jgi:hypothetical protein
MHKLYISYSHSKYRLVSEYDSLAEALREYERYSIYHTTKGDRLKLIWKRD